MEVTGANFKGVPEGTLPEEDQRRQELGLYGSDRALAMGVQVVAARWHSRRLDADGFEDLVERRAELGVVIIQQEVAATKEPGVRGDSREPS